MRSGTIYEGIFHGANTDGNLGVSLKMACVVDKTSDTPQLNLENVIPHLVIKPQDFQQIDVPDVDLTFADQGVLSDAQGNDSHIHTQTINTFRISN